MQHDVNSATTTATDRHQSRAGACAVSGGEGAARVSIANGKRELVLIGQLTRVFMQNGDENTSKRASGGQALAALLEYNASTAQSAMSNVDGAQARRSALAAYKEAGRRTMRCGQHKKPSNIHNKTHSVVIETRCPARQSTASAQV